MKSVFQPPQADLAWNFETARKVMNGSRVAKLRHPGLPKFLRRIAARNGLLSGRVATDLFFGGTMTVVLPEVISEALYTYGLFDETVTWMALQTVRDGDCVLDVGAHYGYFSLLFARLAGPSGRIVSFEPTPSTFEILSANIRHHSNIEAINSGAGDEAGTLSIMDYGVRYSAWNTLAGESRLSGQPSIAGRRRQTTVIRLDEVCRCKQMQPDFVKIDAENFEDHVVRGLGEVLAHFHPTLLMESGSEPSLAAASTLLAQGYRPHVSEGPGTLHEWRDSLEEANNRYKDILFLHPARQNRRPTPPPASPMRGDSEPVC